MNAPLTAAQLAHTIPTLTKRDRLMRLASIIRASKLHTIFVFNSVEYMSVRDKRSAVHPASAFALAASDPVLKDAGLQGDDVAAGQEFFQLTNSELHRFSCDCGGAIDSTEMARRVEAIAAAA